MQGKHILVVGGTSGVGLALVEQLREVGAEVSVLSRERGQLPADVAHQSWDATTDLPESIQLPEQIDGLVYCPGTINLKQFRSLEVADFEADFNVNVLGAVRILKACLRPLKKAKGASVVLFSTVAVGQGMPFHASIATAKAGIEGLTRSLAAEWAPRIRVNAVALSLTDTPLAAGLLNNDSKRESAEKRHPLRTVGSPENAAKAARFLLGEGGEWMTGQVLGVDGGLSTLRV